MGKMCAFVSQNLINGNCWSEFLVSIISICSWTAEGRIVVEVNILPNIRGNMRQHFNMYEPANRSVDGVDLREFVQKTKFARKLFMKDEHKIYR